MGICNLIEISQKEIYYTFIKIFSDYSVNVNISWEQFLVFQKRCSYSPEYSFGWFENGKLVGLFMNGIRTINSKLICYGIAAGFTPEYRRRGILTYKFGNLVFSALEKLGTAIFLCEIMRSNLPATKLIQKFGGSISRKIINYRKRIDEIKIGNDFSNDFHFYSENDLSFISQCETNNYKSSWQNSFESINILLSSFYITTIKMRSNIIGYGAINRMQGDIAQFLIQEKFRDRGLGSVLLLKLIKNTNSEYVSFFNVDENNTTLNKFLTKKEFEIYAKNYEMIRYF